MGLERACRRLRLTATRTHPNKETAAPLRPFPFESFGGAEVGRTNTRNRIPGGLGFCMASGCAGRKVLIALAGRGIIHSWGIQ